MSRIPQVPARPSVTIIGGGIIGLMSAFHLRQALPEAHITVLEKGRHIPNPFGTSTRSAACFRQQFAVRHNVEMSIYGEQFYRNFGRLTGETMKLFWQKGYLFLHRDERRWEQAVAAYANQLDWGLRSVRVLSPTDVAKEFPYVSTEGLVGATFCPTDGYLDPGSIITGLKDYLAAKGVHIMTETKVVGFETEGDRVTTVVCDLGHFKSDYVLNCSGAWSHHIGRLLGVELAVSPEKRYLWSAEMHSGNGGFTQETFTGVPMIVCCGSNGHTPYIRPNPGSQPHSFTIGCEHQVQPEPDFEDHRQNYVEPDFLVCGDGFLAVAETLKSFAPFVEGLSFHDRVSGGFYETTRSHNPYITYDPRWCNVVHACGFSGHGIMHGPAAGQMASDLVRFGDYRSFPTAEGSVTHAAHVNGTGETEHMKI
ncbi:MAG: FAD-binding oxidoreductase [Patescibacteria group bacterium]|nr:FAD-binding oxidoreductase [Patescibacteria group bacterium]